MRRLDHIDNFDVGDHGWRHRAPAFLIATRCYGGSASSQSSPQTLTSSGASSPIQSGGSASATSGSIALGSGAKYQESGSIDLSGAQVGGVSGGVSASGGSTINVGDPALDSALGNVINNLTNGGSIPVSLAGGGALGGGTTVVESAAQPTSSSWLDNINWTLVLIAGAVLAAGALAFVLIEGKK